MKTLILASQSPRRFEILKKENYFFVPFPVYVSEIPDKNLSLNDQIIDIARRKAIACLDQCPVVQAHTCKEFLILSADTMVCIDGHALGKPLDEEDAYKTLQRLSGKIHQVKTALYLIEVRSQQEVAHIETSHVKFKTLSENDIRDYLSRKEYVDKAGSYAIQGEGHILVEKYDGDYNNIVGLPLDALKKIFNQFHWNIKSAE